MMYFALDDDDYFDYYKAWFSSLDRGSIRSNLKWYSENECKFNSCLYLFNPAVEVILVISVFVCVQELLAILYHTMAFDTKAFL